MTTVLYYGDAIADLSLKHVKQSTQNIQKYCCHQWLSDSFRVRQIRFWPGLRLGPDEEAHSTLQTLQVV